MTRTGSLSEPNYRTRSLLDEGTRYNHLQDLRDFWMEGLEVIKNIPEQYVSKAQEIKRDHLNSGIYLLTVEIERLAGYDTEKFKLKRTLEDIEMCRHYDKIEPNQDSST